MSFSLHPGEGFFSSSSFPPPTGLFYWLVIKYCLRFPHSSRAVGERHTKGLSVRKKANVCTGKDDEKARRGLLQQPRPYECPSEGSGGAKRRCGASRELSRACSAVSSLTFIFTLLNRPWEGRQEQPDLYLISLWHLLQLRLSQFPPNKKGIL